VSRNTRRAVDEVAQDLADGKFVGEQKLRIANAIELFDRAHSRYMEGEGDVIFGLRRLDALEDKVIEASKADIMTPNPDNMVDERKRLNKFEFMLLTLSLNIGDLPLEAEQLKHLQPLIESVKKAHEEIVATEVKRASEIDHSIDVRYEADPIEAFNKFIKKYCPDHYPHLIDDDENDGEFMREKIRATLNPSEKEIE
jgi:hypothetical protein